MYSICFDEKNEILQVTFSRTIDKKEVLNYLTSLVTNENLPQHLKIIQDFTDAKYNFEITDLNRIAKKVKHHLRKFKTIKIASIHDKSAETAMSLIFSSLIDSENLNYQLFINKESAFLWLANE